MLTVVNKQNKKIGVDGKRADPQAQRLLRVRALTTILAHETTIAAPWRMGMADYSLQTTLRVTLHGVRVMGRGVTKKNNNEK